MQISSLPDTNCIQKYSFKHVHEIRCLSISTYTSLKAHNSLVQTKCCITYKWSGKHDVIYIAISWTVTIYISERTWCFPQLKNYHIVHTIKATMLHSKYHQRRPYSTTTHLPQGLEKLVGNWAVHQSSNLTVLFHSISLVCSNFKFISLLLCLMICILIYLICTLCSLVTCNECLLCIHNSVCKSSKNPCSQKNVWRQLSLRYLFFQGRPSMSQGSLNSIGNLIQCPSWWEKTPPSTILGGKFIPSGNVCQTKSGNHRLVPRSQCH